MNALLFSAIGEVTSVQIPKPEAGPGMAVVRVAAAGICGSDLTGFLGHSPRRRPPLVLGHEMVGTVISAPPGDWGFEEGDRVVANPLLSCGTCEACGSGRTNLCADWTILGMDTTPGAFAEYIVVPASNLFALPPDMPDLQAVMIEPLSNGVHLMSLVRQHRFGSLAIFGAGCQGALILSLARLLGYRDIAVVNPNPARLAVAGELGATRLVDPRNEDPARVIREWTGGRGVDTGIDAVGSTATRQGVLASVRKGGEILLLGLHEVMSSVDFTAIVRQEQRLQGSFTYTPQDFATARRLLEKGDVSILPWTETRPLEKGQAAFDLLTSVPGPVLKIVLTPM